MTTPIATRDPGEAGAGPRVLVVDADRDIAELVEAVLSDAGYAVSLLYQLEGDIVATAVGRLEPDCVLLDSGGGYDYGSSWALAERLAVRGRPVPVVMFSTRPEDLREATAHETARSRAAHFAGVLGKPFDLEYLLDVVARATGASVSFDRSPQADAARTHALVERLRAGGASDIRRATRREWVTFRAPSGRLMQLYWWQRMGVYLCGAYDETSGAMAPIGRFVERDAAVECALAA